MTLIVKPGDKKCHSGLLNRDNARILYCPSDVHGADFGFDTRLNPWVDRTPSVGTRIDYAVRPVLGVIQSRRAEALRSLQTVEEFGFPASDLQEGRLT